MGRIRTLKPEFHSHEALSSLPSETHLLAAALVNYADDEGYFNANPKLVKAGTNPLREDHTPIDLQLYQLVKIGYIEVRQKGNYRFGKICNFTQHQKVAHPCKSKIRLKFEEMPDPLHLPHELFSPEQGTGNREQGTGKEKTPEPQAAPVSVPAPQPEPIAGTPEPVTLKLISDERDAVERVFAYYCAILERDPKRYGLTPQRREKATARLRERQRCRDGDLRLAETDLAAAVENLANSDFHRENGFIDWIDHIFKSQECFEKRLNWTKPNGGKTNGTRSKGGASMDALIKSLSQEGRNQVSSRENGGSPRSAIGGSGIRGLLG